MFVFALFPACSPAAPPAAAPVPTPAPAAPSASPSPGPKPDATLTPEQRVAFRAAVKAGRTAFNAKDYLVAVERFDAALALSPDDPRALSERGWCHFQAGHLAEAEADALAAIGRSTDTQLLGATWYNLGRIREAQARTPEAAAAYRTSLGLRANETVRKRLEALGGVPPEPYVGVAMAGPFPSLDAWCDTRKRAHADEGAVLCDPTGEELGGLEGPRSAVGAPFTEVRVLGVAAPMFAEAGWDCGTVHYSLAVRTDAGWFTADDITYAYNPGAFGIHEGVTVHTLEVRDGRVVFDLQRDRGDTDMGLNEVQTDEERSLVVCAMVGGAPRCIPPVTTASRSERFRLFDEEPEEPGIEHEFFERGWKGEAILAPDGTLEITGPADAPPGVVGRHRLVFE